MAETSGKIAVARGDLFVSLIYADLCNHPRCAPGPPERTEMFGGGAAAHHNKVVSNSSRVIRLECWMFNKRKLEMGSQP